MNESVTHKGLRIEAPDTGDIVTVMLKSGDGSYRDAIFEVCATSGSAAVCTIVWSSHSWLKVGTKLIFRHSETTYHEASDLLVALQD